MRQRKIKDIENKLLAYKDLIVEDPTSVKGSWRDLFNVKGDKLFVEIGCGKGDFILASSQEDSENAYVAIEGFSSVIIRATAKVKESELKNVLFIQDFVVDLGAWFDEGEVNGIFLNFSDPRPKKKNAKRRLTYRDRLEQYSKALASDGFLRIKTDNDDFFDFTLEEIASSDYMTGFKIVSKTRDLHNSPWEKISPKTEYERKFSSLGKNINFVELRK